MKAIQPAVGRFAGQSQQAAVPKQKRLARSIASRFSGGVGNRTPVPWYFSVGIYVCSLSFFDSQALRPAATFAQPLPGKQGGDIANRL